MKKQQGNIVVEVVLFLIVCVIFAVIALVSMATSNEDSAMAAAETQGYSNMKVKSVHRFFSAEIHGCSDWKATVLQATNPIGKQVEIIVCEGLIVKGATIRTK